MYVKLKNFTNIGLGYIRNVDFLEFTSKWPPTVLNSLTECEKALKCGFKAISSWTEQSGFCWSPKRNVLTFFTAFNSDFQAYYLLV